MVILLNSPGLSLDKEGVLERVKQLYLQNGQIEDAKALEGVQIT